jgi:hypothetical protein
MMQDPAGIGGGIGTDRRSVRLGGAARLAVLALLPALGGCFLHHGAKPASPAPAVAAPLQPLPSMDRLYYDNGGGIQDSVRRVVRTPQELAESWQQATAGQPTPPPIPAVDFTRAMVLVVGAGRMTPADRIQVDSVGVGRQTTPEGKTQEVFTAWVSVVKGCQPFQSDAYPVEIVRVRRFDGPVRFSVQHVKATGCQ